MSPSSMPAALLQRDEEVPSRRFQLSVSEWWLRVIEARKAEIGKELFMDKKRSHNEGHSDGIDAARNEPGLPDPDGTNDRVSIARQYSLGWYNNLSDAIDGTVDELESERMNSSASEGYRSRMRAPFQEQGFKKGRTSLLEDIETLNNNIEKHLSLSSMFHASLKEVDTVSLSSDDDSDSGREAEPDQGAIGSPTAYFSQLSVLHEEDELTWFEVDMDAEPALHGIHLARRQKAFYSFEPIIEVRKERLPVVREGDESCIKTNTSTPECIEVSWPSSVRSEEWREGTSPTSLSFPYDEE